MRKAKTAWKPPPRVLTLVGVEESDWPAVTFVSRPYAFGYRLSILTRGKPPGDVVDPLKPLNAHLSKGRMPRTCSPGYGD
jgi:hypothetical protein